jgi:hypothetical protein
VEGFYDPRTGDVARLALIRETGARYVFWGPAERALGDWDPASADYLEEIYREGSYAILEVKRE